MLEGVSERVKEMNIGQAFLCQNIPAKKGNPDDSSGGQHAFI